jgi:hypothetical protein
LYQQAFCSSVSLIFVISLPRIIHIVASRDSHSAGFGLWPSRCGNCGPLSCQYLYLYIVASLDSQSAGFGLWPSRCGNCGPFSCQYVYFRASKPSKLSTEDSFSTFVLIKQAN